MEKDFQMMKQPGVLAYYPRGTIIKLLRGFSFLDKISHEKLWKFIMFSAYLVSHRNVR